MPRRLAALLVLSPLLACGGTSEEVLCPAGTVRAGSVCVAAGDAGPGDLGVVPVPDAGPPVDAGALGEAAISSLTVAFGRTGLGITREQGLEVTNPSASAAMVRAGAVTGPNREDFSITSSRAIPPGGLELAPGESVTLTVAFTASAEGAREASVVLELCEAGCPATIALAGVGLLDAWSCAPTSLDFGRVNPEACLGERTECTNGSDYEASIVSAEIDASSSAAYSIRSGAVFPMVTPAGGVAAVEVVYCPAALAADQGLLIVETDTVDPGRAQVSIPLEGSGGGPNLVCPTVPIDFGPTVVGASRTRTLTCRNAGNEELLLVPAFQAGGAPELTLISGASESVSPGAEVTLELLFSPVAPGPARALLELGSNDRDTPSLSIAIAGEGVTPNGCALAFTPPAFDFGGVPIGETSRAALTVTSTGTGGCQVEIVGLSPGTGSEMSLVNPPGTVALAPGASLLLELDFTPTAARAYTGAVELSTDDYALLLPTFVGAAGEGLGAAYPLSVSPGALDFGAVPAGCSNTADQLVTVSNSGSAALVSASFAPGSSPAFLVDGGATASFALGSGRSHELTVSVAPGTFGRHDARLLLRPSAQSPAIAIALTAVGAVAPVVTETFNVPAVAMVDLLIVVDDSASMAEEQANLALAAQVLIDRADLSGSSYQLGVTTTDPGDLAGSLAAGTLRGTPAVISSSSPTRVADLEAAILQGTVGSAFEQGLFAATQAVTDPALLAGPNAGFSRAGAELVVLVLSDEQDQSPDPVTSYVAALAGRPNAAGAGLRIFSITGGLSGCAGPGGVADLGSRYVDAAQRTGGFDRSICDASFITSVAEIADAAFAAEARAYDLASIPAPLLVEVVVDGVALPARTGTVAAWGVDFAAGELVFAPGRAPAPGETFTVTYTTQCEPIACGDGIVALNEVCDDGNTDDADACPATCHPAVCGDAYIAAAEQCDDQNTIDGDGCNGACIIEGCGNGLVELGEECDDGALNSDVAADACRTSCVAASCHDAVLDSGEECDDGDLDDTDACVGACQVALCGDGFVQAGVEACDDGNLVDGDTCTNTCTLNIPSFTVTSSSSIPLTPSGGTPITWLGSSDDGYADVAIGFPFSFLGSAVSSVFPGTNGFIGFSGPSSALSNQSLPNLAAPNGLIAWWWDDLHFGLSSAGPTSATTTLLGAAPDRVRVFTFLNVPRYGSVAGAAGLNAEVRLFEGSNAIEVHYGAVTGGSTTFSASAGWESPDGLYGANVLGCTTNCSTANWPANTVFRYTP